ncbi:hypothetical protein L0337_35405 [candidate division KSB1 bacterium]|nr:hypothetical protein [candidate division KSB1 bacterium]
MKLSKLAQLRAAVEDWTRLHNVDATLIEVKPSGIGSNIHVLVVARRGFENWPRHERRNDLFNYLHQHANPDNDLVLTLVLTMTEEEYEKYERVEIGPDMAAV